MNMRSNTYSWKNPDLTGLLCTFLFSMLVGQLSRMWCVNLGNKVADTIVVVNIIFLIFPGWNILQYQLMAVIFARIQSWMIEHCQLPCSTLLT